MNNIKEKILNRLENKLDSDKEISFEELNTCAMIYKTLDMDFKNMMSPFLDIMNKEHVENKKEKENDT